MVKEKDPIKKETGKAMPKKQTTGPVKAVLLKKAQITGATMIKKTAPVKSNIVIKKAVGKENTERVNKRAIPEGIVKTGSYTEAVGRRKTAIARVRLYKDGKGEYNVNGKTLDKYFASKELERIIHSPFEKLQEEGGYSVTVITRGGGIHAQAEAIRHGISRCLVSINEENKKRLRGAGFLTRDSRMRERKKFGLLRARRAPQFSKR